MNGFNIPPGPLSPGNAARLTSLLQSLSNVQKIRAAPPLAVRMDGGIPIISTNDPPRILIQISGHEPFGEYDSSYPEAPPGYNPDSADYYDQYPDCRYSWFEVDVDPTVCGYAPVPGGRRGWVDKFPAVPIDTNDALADGMVVEAWLAPSGTHWRFQPPGDNSATIDITVIDCVELLISDSL